MTDAYETEEVLSQYLDFQFGSGEPFGVPNYPAACARLCLDAMAADDPRRRALDLGCAVGRTAMELARAFDAVDDLDTSRAFIDAACLLRDRGRLDYSVVDEGDLRSARRADLASLELDDAARRVSFAVGDAARLAAPDEPYDLVFAGNLIDRLAEPGAFLDGLARQLRPGGWLVIASPYTLRREYTPYAQWIGGYYGAAGTPVTVRDGLHQRLAPAFVMAREPVDQPFVIRETRRKFQHTVAEVTFWRRRNDQEC